MDTSTCADLNPTAALNLGPDVRATRLILPDGQVYVLALNLINTPTTIADLHGTLLGGAGTLAKGTLTLAAQGAALIHISTGG